MGIVSQIHDMYECPVLTCVAFLLHYFFGQIFSAVVYDDAMPYADLFLFQPYALEQFVADAYVFLGFYVLYGVFDLVLGLFQNFVPEP